MHALIVVPPAHVSSSRTGARLDIFPGSSSPAMFPAGAPFWVGYGFTVASPVESGPGVDADTRFELAVDGKRIELVVEVEVEGGISRSKLEVASFPRGLDRGWHRFEGRWYDEGALVLTTDKTIQFVGERFRS